ncbi:MAG TPA: adenylate/guanylate cyclase domain-containing protein [Oligoflexus sp.]|uniref:adenylate/guanylate cyclase domain-containing protein n=1 Tax=Oligoflexus sp. TaxID=1971216 RepID=UPI002D2B6854|nr:adenylate/guanylate cyclase domain-containing protein [Oligoflexus sp.]HYX37067.1 adenylate/guanylate cyclase domain-containing protein [Oligoflexus sp.]
MTLSITQIFHPTELAQYESQGDVLSHEFIVAEPIEKVWAVISDHDHLRRKLGLSLVDFTYHPVTEGGTMLEGEYRVPFGKAHFYEKPFEWIAGSYCLGIRLFDKGPVRYASLGFYVESVGAGQTKIKAVMKIVLKGPLKGVFLHKLNKSAAKFPRIIQELVKNLESIQPQSFEASMRPKPDRLKLQRARIALKKLEPFHAQIEALADYHARAADRFLQRLRPYEIADHYKLPRQNTLAFFLEGTQVGLFALNWDILCPACRGAKKQNKSLREIEKKVHCETCGLNFDVIESKDVELSFAFAGDLSVEPAPIYCIGNPGRSPNIHVQLPFAPHETRKVQLRLPGLSYRLRDMKQGHIVRLAVDPEGLSTLSRRDMESLRLQSELRVQPQVMLDWDNPTDQWQVLRFDCLDPNLDAATADQVASLPAYQHLFGDDALRPGMQLGVGHLVFLFSDIRGSTQMYREMGDSKAFRLVQDHFAAMEKFIRDEQGSIVKTIGDAVMASFNSETSALAAAIAIQKFYAIRTQGYSLHGLKIALHSGPCIMVNLNDRMDYFGTTVNICSRLLDMASDEDIIVSGSLLEMPKVQEFLSQQNLTWTQDEQVLRGFQGTKTFYRLKLQRQMPQRLIS